VVDVVLQTVELKQKIVVVQRVETRKRVRDVVEEIRMKRKKQTDLTVILIVIVIVIVIVMIVIVIVIVIVRIVIVIVMVMVIVIVMVMMTMGHAVKMIKRTMLRKFYIRTWPRSISKEQKRKQKKKK